MSEIRICPESLARDKYQSCIYERCEARYCKHRRTHEHNKRCDPEQFKECIGQPKTCEYGYCRKVESR